MYSARIKLPARLSEDEVRIFSNALDLGAHAHVVTRENHEDDKDWRLEWIIEMPIKGEDFTDLASLVIAGTGLNFHVDPKTFVLEEIPEKDWLQEGYRPPKPFSVGPFFIHGSHSDGSSKNKAPEGQMGLHIDAATAFGSGEHGTTKGCLQAMLDLKGQGVCPWNVLDLGCGSGILSIAAWKLWKTPILAVDVEEEAVRVTEQHREINKIPQGSSNITVLQSDGFASESVAKKKPFELIIANILIGPLKAMAGDIFEALDQNSYVILSGILEEQKNDILKTYAGTYDLTLKREYSIDGWSTLVLHKA